MSGYKKPPKDTQFKKGTSGNPKGRPKGKKNKTTADLLNKELNSKLKLKDGSSLSKREAAVKNFSNNALQTKKLHESARAIELMTKVEKETHQDAVAQAFLKKMIDDKYINSDDAEDFARNRKDPKFNFPKALNKIHNTHVSKDIAAWEAVKNVGFLGFVHDSLTKIDAIELFVYFIRDEMKFWDNVENKAFLETDFTEEEFKDIFSILETTREYAKPTQNILNTLLKFARIQKHNLDYMMFSERDRLIGQGLYKTNEKVYFDEDRIEKAIAKTDTDISHKVLHEAQDEWHSMYDEFISTKYKGTIQDISDILSSEDSEELVVWLKSSQEPKKTFEEAIDEIVEKYGE